MLNNWVNSGKAKLLGSMPILSQAVEGLSSTEGQETRRLSPNNNVFQERPTSYWDDDIVRYSYENRRVSLNGLHNNSRMKDEFDLPG